MSYDAGEIQYTVSVETAESVKAAKEIEKSLKDTERGMNKTKAGATKLNRAMSPLALAIRKAFSKSGTDRIKATENAMGNVRSMALRLASVLGVALSVKAFGGMIKANIDLAQTTLDVAEKLGTTTEAVSSLRFAAEQSSGMLAGEFDVALQRMTRRLAEAAQGGGVAKDAITELGLDAKRLAASDPADAFKQIMEQMSLLPNQADRVRMAFKFFDSGGVKLAQTSKLGAEGIEELSEKLREMGGVITTESAQKATELNAKIGEMNARFSALGMTIAEDAMPHLDEFVELFNDPELVENISTLASAIVQLGGVAVTVGSEFGDLINQVGYFTKWLSGSATGLETVDRKIKDVKRSMESTGMSTTLGGMWYSKEELQEQLEQLEKQRDILKMFARDEPSAAASKPPRKEIPLGTPGGTKESTKETRDANAELVKSLQLVKDTLGMTQEAAVVYKMGTESATKAQQDQAKSLLDSIKVFKQAEEAEKVFTTTVKDLQSQLDLASLSGLELAKTQAELGLGEYATPQQIAEVRQLAGALFELSEQQDAIKEFGKDPEGAIRGDVPILSGGRFDDGTARYEAEKEAEIKRSEEQLQRLEEARAAGIELEKGYDELREELYSEHMARMTEIDRVRLDAQLDMWGSGFGNMASDLQNFASVFATESKTMFGISKAAGIAEAIINTYKAATGAYSAMASIPVVGPGLGIAAASAAIAGGMANVAKIRTAQMGGARFYGGPVDADKFHKVNEGGLPEIFKGRDGHQYLMPNQQGDVVSNKNASGGGGVNVTVNLHQSQERAGQVDHGGQDSANQIIDIFVADIMGDGKSAGAIQGKWNLSPQGF